MTHIDRQEVAAIFVGGMLGAVLRVWVGLQLNSTAGDWPWATFVINITGTVALAYLVTRLQERLPPSTYRRPLLATGFCGAYTTFSTMQVEILKMLDRGHDGLAIGYALASTVAGFAAIWMTTAYVRRSRLT